MELNDFILYIMDFLQTQGYKIVEAEVKHPLDHTISVERCKDNMKVLVPLNTATWVIEQDTAEEILACIQKAYREAGEQKPTINYSTLKDDELTIEIATRRGYKVIDLNDPRPGIWYRMIDANYQRVGTRRRSVALAWSKNAPQYATDANAALELWINTPLFRLCSLTKNRWFAWVEAANDRDIQLYSVDAETPARVTVLCWLLWHDALKQKEASLHTHASSTIVRVR